MTNSSLRIHVVYLLIYKGHNFLEIKNRYKLHAYKKKLNISSYTPKYLIKMKLRS